MALMFSRLAHNYVKNGYYPTDEESIRRISNLLQMPEKGGIRMFDPCCGEGIALADLRQLLTVDRGRIGGAEAFGIELDRDRARHAKGILDRVIHSDVHDVVLKPRSMGLLFLNPPYGFGVADQSAQRSLLAEADKAERLERTFLRKTVPYLAYGGVLVYIIPHYALDDEIRSYLVRNFEDLRIFMAPVQQFRQCIVIGKRCRATHATKAALQPLTEAQASEEGAPVIPDSWELEPYVIPALQVDQEFDFHAVQIDAEQLGDELDKYESSLLWSGLSSQFSQVGGACRPPLRDLTPWHLALALAAGQVVGMIHGAGGRTLLIKGDTYKRKERKVSVDFDEKGQASQTTVMLDRFVPVINAIEFTPDHRLGRIVNIA